MWWANSGWVGLQWECDGAQLQPDLQKDETTSGVSAFLRFSSTHPSMFTGIWWGSSQTSSTVRFTEERSRKGSEGGHPSMNCPSIHQPFREAIRTEHLWTFSNRQSHKSSKQHVSGEWSCRECWVGNLAVPGSGGFLMLGASSPWPSLGVCRIRPVFPGVGFPGHGTRRPVWRQCVGVDQWEENGRRHSKSWVRAGTLLGSGDGKHRE